MDIDVVSGWRHRWVEGNRLYGRGALDMKGAMDGALVLLEVVERDESFPGRLIVTFVTDEEHSSIGRSPARPRSRFAARSR